MDEYGELVVDHHDIHHVDETADWDIDHLHSIHHPRNPHEHTYVDRMYDSPSKPKRHSERQRYEDREDEPAPRKSREDEEDEISD